MKTIKSIIILIVFCVAFVSIESDGFAKGIDVSKWTIHEISLNSSQEYGNPFQDVIVTATFRTPSNNEMNINGFYAGEGIWKIRFILNELGTWSYVIYSNDEQIDGQTGFVNCIPSQDLGPIVIDPDYPHHFKFADGGHFYYNGNTCKALFATPKSGPYGGWKDFIDYCAEMKFNSIIVYLYIPTIATSSSAWAGRPDEIDYHVSVWPMKGDSNVMGDIQNPSTIDFNRFYLPYWDKVDHIAQYMKKKGIVAYIFFHSDDAVNVTNDKDFSNPTALTRDQEKLYFKYALARLASYTNVRWVLCLEYNEYRDDAWAREMGNFVKQNDPYEHLLSVHSHMDFHFGDEDWADFIVYQGSAFETPIYLEDRKYNKPMANDENGYEPRKALDYEVRMNNWVLAMTGVYSSYGHIRQMGTDFTDLHLDDNAADSIKIMYKFMTSLEWWKMEPHNELVNADFYCLANPGEEYVVYLPPGERGRKITLDLTNVSGSLNIEWLNNTNGRRRGAGTVEGGKIQSFKPPKIIEKEAILHIWKG